jgi:ketosteroid isomerase-like protein
VTEKFATEEVAEATKDPAIAAVLAARRAGVAAALTHDSDAWTAGLAADLVVNTPGNAVARREGVLRFFEAGRISYDSADSIIEFAEARGNLVVLMGEEVVTPRDATPHSGQTVHRRFTDVWRKDDDGVWRLTIRQATNTSVT